MTDGNSVQKFHGVQQGPVRRLISPTLEGEMLKPFVFLDLAKIKPGPRAGFGWHPHSGIATVTLILEGRVEYRETSGRRGELGPGGVEWMSAGRGVWHMARPTGTGELQAFQLWIALPPDRENAAPTSQHLDATQIEQRGSTRVILGEFEAVRGGIDAPAGINYFDILLGPGERWEFDLPDSHDVVWLAVATGAVVAGEVAFSGDMLVFAPRTGTISVTSPHGARFVFGSAMKSRERLVVGNYSVHSNDKSLWQGEAEIERIALAVGPWHLVP